MNQIPSVDLGDFLSGDKSKRLAFIENLGKAYEVNTSNYHSAVNFGTEFRYHLIGVKYV